MVPVICFTFCENIKIGKQGHLNGHNLARLEITDTGCT